MHFDLLRAPQVQAVQRQTHYLLPEVTSVLPKQPTVQHHCTDRFKRHDQGKVCVLGVRYTCDHRRFRYRLECPGRSIDAATLSDCTRFTAGPIPEPVTGNRIPSNERRYDRLD
jgi:hypothetical protein